MEIMGTLQRYSLLFVFLLVLCYLPGNTAISCYTCVDERSNEDCNIATVTCDGSCYTTVKKLEATGKRYDKGCMDTAVCDALDSLRDRKYCPYFPSECTYCCTDKNQCNAFNQAPVSGLTSQLLHVVCPLLCILIKMFFS